MTPIQIRMLNNILNIEEGLTDWEIQFIESLNKSREEPLSEKQDKILTRIYEEKGL
jgi:hypothetical protein